MVGPTPNFVIAGAGRAGTTGLVAGLRRHPGVFVTDPKEPHYLAMHGTRPDFRGPGDRESINQRAITRERDYRDLFAAATGQHRARGEGSVSTLYYYERALPELLRLDPEVRVVVLLREPVGRAWSSFQYLRAQGREPEQEFLDAISDEARRRDANWHHLWHYTAMSEYAKAIRAMQDGLRPGHLGVWFHDDLERDYDATLREVVQFLGLRPVEVSPGDVPYVNVSGTPRFRRLQKTMWRAQGHEGVRRAGRLLTTWRFREAVKARMLRCDGVPEDAARELAPRFEDDLVELRRVLGPTPHLPGWLARAGEASMR